MDLSKINKLQVNSIIKDIILARQLADYEAVEVLWVALVKFSNLMHGKNEHKRMLNLANCISLESINNIVLSHAVSDLLQLDQPLETVLASPHEHLCPDKVKSYISNFIKFRESDPRSALIHLGDILKIIRNKRAHGFKTRNGPRDRAILAATRAILQMLCNFAAKEFIK